MQRLFAPLRTRTNVGHGKFFRSRLLTLDAQGIAEYTERLDKEAKAIKSEALNLAWHMRGGLTYEEAVSLSNVERSQISDLIKEHFETTKKTGLPYF